MADTGKAGEGGSGCLTDLAMTAYETIHSGHNALVGPHMTNFDGTIDEGCEEALERGDPITHSAWEFNGLVVLRDGIYVEWVRRYGSVVCRHTGSALKTLMEDVNAAHGWD